VSRAVPGYACFDTPAGPCGLAWNDAGELLGAQLPEGGRAATLARLARRFPGLAQAEPPEAVARTMQRWRAVLAEGSRDTLADVPICYHGVPPFHQRVLELTRQIPPGQTRSYGDLARALGDLSLARAVGQALGANPFAPIVPCHRVMAAGGQAGGFSGPGGLKGKLGLLQWEGAPLGAQSDRQPGLF
jgi:methylated-DNA-[protein]-cysteine S-methyltransferase